MRAEERVQFAHPQSGQPHQGRVIGRGRHGVTVEDDAGDRHQVPHGRTTPHEEAEPDTGEQDADERSSSRAAFDSLHAHHKGLQEFRARAHKDLRLGAASKTAVAAACALLTEYTGGRPVHHLSAKDVQVDGDHVVVDADGHADKIHDPRLAAWLKAALKGRRGAAFVGQEHDGAPVDVDGDRVDQYLEAHLASDTDQVKRHHATRAWTAATAELGKPASKKQAETHAENAAYQAGVDLEDVDPTVKRAHHRYGLIPDKWGDGLKSQEKGLGDHLRSVQQADPFEDHYQPDQPGGHRA